MGKLKTTEQLVAEDVREIVRNHYNPDDIFDERELENWAESNGYVKDVEQD